MSTGDVPLAVVVLDVPESVRDASRANQAGPALARGDPDGDEGQCPPAGRSQLDRDRQAHLPPPAARPSPPWFGAHSNRFGRRTRCASKPKTATSAWLRGGTPSRLPRKVDSRVGPRRNSDGVAFDLGLPVDRAIRELAGDVPGSPYLRNGLAVDLIGQVRDDSGRYHLIGSLQPQERVSQLCESTTSRRPTNLAEGFPSFAVSAHGHASSGGIVETKFYDFVKTPGGAELATRLERVVEGHTTQTIRIEGLKENSGLAEVPFELARLGGLAARPSTNAAPAPPAGKAARACRGAPCRSWRRGICPVPGEPHAAYNSSPPTSGPRPACSRRARPAPAADTARASGAQPGARSGARPIQLPGALPGLGVPARTGGADAAIRRDRSLIR